MTQASLRAAGGALGAGIVVALPESSCALAETARIARYLAEEGARQCGPCRMGLPALAGALADLAYHGGRGRAAAAAGGLIGLVEGRGACRHPDGAAQLARSALRSFPADADWHDRYGPCDGVRRAPLLPLPDDSERDWDWT
jgi:NADH:ubiquinone oxidoreductase subunit F (NADH-binding)